MSESQVLGLQAAAHLPGFYVSSEDLNYGPLTDTTSMFIHCAISPDQHVLLPKCFWLESP